MSACAGQILRVAEKDRVNTEHAQKSRRRTRRRLTDCSHNKNVNMVHLRHRQTGALVRTGVSGGAPVLMIPSFDVFFDVDVAAPPSRSPEAQEIDRFRVKLALVYIHVVEYTYYLTSSVRAFLIAYTYMRTFMHAMYQ